MSDDVQKAKKLYANLKKKKGVAGSEKVNAVSPDAAPQAAPQPNAGDASNPQSASVEGNTSQGGEAGDKVTVIAQDQDNTLTPDSGDSQTVKPAMDTLSIHSSHEGREDFKPAAMSRPPDPANEPLESQDEAERMLQQLEDDQERAKHHRQVDRSVNQYEIREATLEAVEDAVEQAVEKAEENASYVGVASGSDANQFREAVNDQAIATVCIPVAHDGLQTENERLKEQIKQLEAQVRQLQRELHEARQDQLEVSITSPPKQSQSSSRLRASSFVDEDLHSAPVESQTHEDLEKYRSFRLDLRDWGLSRGVGPIITI